MKVLIIEEKEQISTLLKLAIEKLGHKVTIAENGRKALDIIKTKMVDLILLDVFPPDIAAHDLIPRLKREWSGMKIITMSGHGSREVEEKVRKQGILYYMVKPIDLFELKSIIQHMGRKIDMTGD